MFYLQLQRFHHSRSLGSRQKQWITAIPKESWVQDFQNVYFVFTKFRTKNCDEYKMYQNILHMCLDQFYLAHEKIRLRPLVHLAIHSMSISMSAAHLGHSVFIVSYGVCGAGSQRSHSLGVTFSAQKPLLCL